MNTAQAVEVSDIIMILVNDEKQAALYQKDIKDHLSEERPSASPMALTSILKQIVPPADINVIMIAPKGPGHTVPFPVCGRKGRSLPGSRLSESQRKLHGDRQGIRGRHRRSQRRNPGNHL